MTFRSAYSGAADHQAMVAMLAVHPPAERGRKFRYSNVGYNVAGLAMRERLDLDCAVPVCQDGQRDFAMRKI